MNGGASPVSLPPKISNLLFKREIEGEGVPQIHTMSEAIVNAKSGKLLLTVAHLLSFRWGLQSGDR